ELLFVIAIPDPAMPVISLHCNTAAERNLKRRRSVIFVAILSVATDRQIALGNGQIRVAYGLRAVASYLEKQVLGYQICTNAQVVGMKDFGVLEVTVAERLQ